MSHILHSGYQVNALMRLLLELSITSNDNSFRVPKFSKSCRFVPPWYHSLLRIVKNSESSYQKFRIIVLSVRLLNAGDLGASITSSKLFLTGPRHKIFAPLHSSKTRTRSECPVLLQTILPHYRDTPRGFLQFVYSNIVFILSYR